MHEKVMDSLHWKALSSVTLCGCVHQLILLRLTSMFQKNVPPSCLKLSSPVKNIEWGEDVLPSGSGCKITLISGALIEADHIIFTPSIGVLKEVANEMFTPPLPTKKLKAIEVGRIQG